MISKSLFGLTPQGHQVFNYTFTDQLGQSAVISEYACAILQLNILDPSSNLHDLALGYDTLDEYLADTRCFGATIGRFANRISNGRFSLNGVTYHLPRNNHGNTLHGGPLSFRKQCFSSELHDDCVVFTLHSPDLDCGFPGNFTLKVTVTFNDGALRMRYDYECDKDCPANITNHNYFNLNGHGMGSILNHDIKINAQRYCRNDENCLALAPTVSVEGTPFDFREPKPIQNGIFTYSPELIMANGGYDHCFELSGTQAATAKGDVSGIVLTVNTDMPAMHFYTGNSIGHCRGKGGAYYNDHDGFALECEHFPNAINEPAFPDCVVKAGQPKSEFIEFKFSR